MRHVALLRGIGPGNPKMRNPEIVRVLTEAGLDGVEAVISSGNYVFSSDADRGELEDRIEAAMAAHLGAPCSTIVRSQRQIAALCGLDVFDGRDDAPDARCQVTFLKRRPPAGVELPTGDGYEVLGLQRQAVFFVVDSTRQKTPGVMAAMERTFGPQVTTRTWKTVHRIRAALER